MRAITGQMISNARAFLARVLLVIALGLAMFASAHAVDYPALTGRVVDQASIIPADKKQSLETKLKELEDKSGIQFVVATIKTLDGNAIEPYANTLFRQWKLGEEKNNNGVLLIIAPVERKVRIEVGYGLEGTLTDALSKIVIVNAIAPRFKAGDFGGGIERGVDDVITILTTDASEWEKRQKLRKDQPDLFEQLIPFIVIGLFLFIFITMVRNARGPAGRIVRRGNQTIFIPTSGGTWGSGSSGWSGGSSWGGSSSDGGGFSGGGGSSGGGGASGDW